MLLAMAEASHGVRPSRRRSRRWSPACTGDACRRAATARHWRRCASSPRRSAAGRGPRDPALLHALDGRFIRPAPAATCCARRPCCRPGRNLHGFDPFRIPSAFAVQDGARQAARLLARHAGDGHALPRDGGDRAVGHRQPQDRGRPDRPGAGADRRPAPLRRLWPPRRRRAAAAGRAGPAAHRRDRHAVRHLPRPAAAADQAAGRGLRSWPPRPTSRSS